MLARNKALKIGLILASELLFTQQLLALELGELVLESSLSQPLDATIELQDAAGLDPAQVSVTLGTAEEFAGAGIELSELASKVQFAVEVDGAAANIHLTTVDPVDEPFLDLLLVVSSPDGTTQRDYTILMNLPASTTTSVDSLVIPGTENPDLPTPAAVEATQGDDGTSLNDGGQTYAVADGDSMWEIAAKTRPDSDVSMQQMMLAIQRANEDAFINNNINRVLSGKVLRIPDLQEINLVDQADAIARLDQQNQALAAQPLAVNRSAGNTNPAPEQDELTVLTDDQLTPAAGGSSDLEATLAALESEVMLSEESRDRARLENTELTNRFQMLEEEMDLLQNLISVEDARIAQLQADLTTQNETAEQALATTEAATSVLAAQQPAPPAGVTGRVEGWLQNTAVLMAVIGGLLLLVLGYLFWQRRRMNAAAYAFDSGIPELETADNSTFAAAGKTSRGFKGWFSRAGNKNADEETDTYSAYDGRRSIEAAEHSEATGMSDMRDNPVAGTSVQHGYDADEASMVNESSDPDLSRYAEREEISNPSFQNEPDVNEFAVAGTTSSAPDTMSAGDEAELADALIAEARGIADAEQHFGSEHDPAGTTEAEKEAHDLAELITPDVEMTESEIPESFEFTLTTAPEALAEQAQVETADDLESFDFQLSDSPSVEQDQPTTPDKIDEPDFSGDDSVLNTLLLDEDEGDFEAAAPLNECDTKLDLAVAYEAMGDIEGAIEILGEVIADGDGAQIAEANRLKGLWQNS